jgi:hypothetical protein
VQKGMQCMVLSGAAYLPSQLDIISSLAHGIGISASICISPTSIHALLMPSLAGLTTEELQERAASITRTTCELLAPAFGKVQLLPTERLAAAKANEWMLDRQLRLWHPPSWGETLQQELEAKTARQRAIAGNCSAYNPASLKAKTARRPCLQQPQTVTSGLAHCLQQCMSVWKRAPVALTFERGPLLMQLQAPGPAAAAAAEAATGTTTLLLLLLLLLRHAAHVPVFHERHSTAPINLLICCLLTCFICCSCHAVRSLMGPPSLAAARKLVERHGLYMQELQVTAAEQAPAAADDAPATATTGVSRWWGGSSGSSSSSGSRRRPSAKAAGAAEGSSIAGGNWCWQAG